VAYGILFYCNKGPNVRQYTKAMRLFKEDPKWTPLNRGDETDKNQYRQEYLKSRQTLAAAN
jgi:1,2-dihydroxy-3-keto-5-methylthiopentene dioxygenase